MVLEKIYNIKICTDFYMMTDSEIYSKLILVCFGSIFIETYF